MSNVFHIDGRPYVKWQDLLGMLLERDDIQHVVVVVQRQDDISEIVYDAQAIYELMMAAKQLSAFTDDVVMTTLEEAARET